ncbi:hypothetical protein [Bacillus sp. OV166]|uniref:hypothetical protein n=1 Tax=Bacillus sp. OV166 TaxID=1882763 RepID=UPI001155217E|nr:hypothetical protein [Bacillus sp. OV166]
MNKRTDRLAMRRSVFLFYIVNRLSDVSASSFCSCDENSTTVLPTLMQLQSWKLSNALLMSFSWIRSRTSQASMKSANL